MNAKSQDRASEFRKKTDAEIIEEIVAMDAQLASAADQVGRELWSDQVVDIHPSGWKYAKTDVLHTSGRKPLRNVIHADETPKEIIVFNDDAVLETWVSTKYFEVPDPQEEARKLGTMLMEPAKIRRAQEAMVHRPTFGPHEAEAPNPYRLRYVRLWVRENGAWKVGLKSGTRIGVRVHPGMGSDAVAIEEQ